MVCEECRRPSGVDLSGWDAYLVEDDDDMGATARRITFCPECAEREFAIGRYRRKAGARAARAFPPRLVPTAARRWAGSYR
jgi:hypothetical protein